MLMFTLLTASNSIIDELVSLLLSIVIRQLAMLLVLERNQQALHTPAKLTWKLNFILGVYDVPFQVLRPVY